MLANDEKGRGLKRGCVLEAEELVIAYFSSSSRSACLLLSTRGQSQSLTSSIGSGSSEAEEEGLHTEVAMDTDVEQSLSLHTNSSVASQSVPPHNPGSWVVASIPPSDLETCSGEGDWTHHRVQKQRALDRHDSSTDQVSQGASESSLSSVRHKNDPPPPPPPETSTKVQPVSPKVAKRYLEEYYHRLEERSRVRIKELKKTKKRAISFNQADQQRPMKHMMWNTALSLDRGGGLGGHSRRMSVDVDLLLGQTKANRTNQPENPRCNDPATDSNGARSQQEPHTSSSTSTLVTVTTNTAPAKPKRGNKKKWKTGLLKRFVSEPTCTEIKEKPSLDARLFKQKSSPVFSLHGTEKVVERHAPSRNQTSVKRLQQEEEEKEEEEKEEEEEELFELEGFMETSSEHRPATPDLAGSARSTSAPLFRRWSWSKKKRKVRQNLEIKRSSSYQTKLHLSRHSSFRQSDSELEVIGNPSTKFRFPVVGTPPQEGEVGRGWHWGHTGQPTREKSHKRTRLSSLPEPILCRVYTESDSTARGSEDGNRTGD